MTDVREAARYAALRGGHRWRAIVAAVPGRSHRELSATHRLLMLLDRDLERTIQPEPPARPPSLAEIMAEAKQRRVST